MASLIVGMLAAAALAYVAMPLRRPVAFQTEDVPLRDARSRKRAALEALLDLEDERATGKLSEADFADLRTEYEGEAALALRELDLLSVASDDAAEAQIDALRRRLACPACGGPRVPGRPCTRCGA